MAKSQRNIRVLNITPIYNRIVKRRPGIHDYLNKSSGIDHLSPIPKANINVISRNSSASYGTFQKSHSILHRKISLSETSSTKNFGNIFRDNKLVIFSLIGAICATVFCLSPNSPTVENIVSNKILTIKDLQEKYPLQSNDIWDYLRYSVKYTIEQNKPASFLLLYNKSSSKTAFELVNDMASYSLCILNQNHDYSYEPITLNGYEFDQALQNNYILDKYTAELQEKYVMVVLNLDGLSGLQAQNFHFLCDAYSPAAFKSVYFFTVNVDSVNNLSCSDWHIVEGVLRKNWMDLDNDKFYPLLIRITNTLIKVVPEN